MTDESHPIAQAFNAVFRKHAHEAYVSFDYKDDAIGKYIELRTAKLNPEFIQSQLQIAGFQCDVELGKRHAPGGKKLRARQVEDIYKIYPLIDYENKLATLNNLLTINKQQEENKPWRETLRQHHEKMSQEAKERG